MAGEVAYTKISLFGILCGAHRELFGPRRGVSAIPFLFINAMAVATAFSAADLIDPTAFERMAARNGDTYRGFLSKHYAVHWAPVVLTFVWLVADRGRHLRETPWDPMTGGYTAAVHVAWALLNFGTLDMSSVYVELSPGDWYLCWATAVATHLAVGCTWRWMVRAVRT